MRILLVLLALLACSCGRHAGSDSHVHLSIAASTDTPAVGDIVVLSADVETEGRVYFISFDWLTLEAPGSAPTFSNATNTLTNVVFTKAGTYVIALRIYWWDDLNDRRTTTKEVTIVVAPTAPG